METLSTSQNKALAKIVRLARQHGLSGPQIQSALENPAKTDTNISSSFLTSLLGYLGGALILSGLLIYAAMVWEDIGSFARVLLSLGSGVLAFVIGALLQKDQETHKASLPLWIVSAMCIPTGLFVFLKEYVRGDDPILGGVLVFGLCTLVYLTGFSQFRHNALLVFTLLFGTAFAGTLYEHLHINTPSMWLVSGISMGMLAWHTHKSASKEIADFPFIMSGTMLLASTYYYFGNTPYEGIVSSLILAMVFAGFLLEQRKFTLFAVLILIFEFGKYFGFGWGDLRETELKLSAAASGVAMTFAAHWLEKHTESRLPPWLNFFGSALLFSMVMSLWFKTPYDILFPAIPAFVLYVSMKLHSRALLLSSILSLLSFISYYSVEYFADTVGWPVALMISGMALIALCGFALKMSKRMKQEAVNV